MDSIEEGITRLGRSFWRSICLANTLEGGTAIFKLNEWQVEGKGVRANQWSKTKAWGNTKCDGNNQWTRAWKDEHASNNNIIRVDKVRSTRRDWDTYKLTITYKEVE